MSQAHTVISLADLFMVNDSKITKEAKAILESCRKVNSAKYAGFEVFHVFGNRLAFGDGPRPFKINEENTACIEFISLPCSITKTDTAHELLLGFLLALDNDHPAISLSVVTGAPREFLWNAFQIARAYSPDLPEPAWLPAREDGSLNYEAIPSDLDFRA